jgi:hypothetical protein
MDKSLRFTLRRLETRPKKMKSLLTALSAITDTLLPSSKRKISWFISRLTPRSCSTLLRKKVLQRRPSKLSKESLSNLPNSSAIITISASSIRMTLESISQSQPWPLPSGLKSAPMLQFSTTSKKPLKQSKYNYI